MKKYKVKREGNIIFARNEKEMIEMYESEEAFIMCWIDKDYVRSAIVEPMNLKSQMIIGNVNICYKEKLKDAPETKPKKSGRKLTAKGKKIRKQVSEAIDFAKENDMKFGDAYKKVFKKKPGPYEYNLYRAMKE